MSLLKSLGIPESPRSRVAALERNDIAVNVWDLDGRVLRWLLEKEGEPGWFTTIINLPLRPAESVPEFDPAIDSRELHEALSRLEGHGLIAGEHGETLGGAHWSHPRVRADGLMVFGGVARPGSCSICGRARSTARRDQPDHGGG